MTALFEETQLDSTLFDDLQNTHTPRVGVDMSTAPAADSFPPTATTLQAIQDAGEDFEWYPTTQRMIDVVAKRIGKNSASILDIGAGDGRVLVSLAKQMEHAELYAIEKSSVLVQAQPEEVTPVGTDLFEQNLTCLPVDYIFCNPPYSQFETWARAIIDSGYAKRAFLIIPRRWKDSDGIAASLKRRGATARTIHSDDFLDGERRARAVVDIVEVSYPREDRRHEDVKDPFDIWFDQNIDTFDREKEIDDDKQTAADLARINKMASIAELVDAYNEEYARMEENYRAIFRLDYAILKELGISKDHVRDGIKKKMAGLKNKYWHALFEKMDAITKRLTTKTKQHFLERLTGRATVAFTAANAYAIVLWAIKHANKYFNEQLVQLFRDLSTHDGVMNYKSNQRTWQKDHWRYGQKEINNTHYALDYRIVLCHYAAIANPDKHGYISTWDYPGNLHKTSHDVVADVVAVFCNLGFATYSLPSLQRQWESNQWQDFYLSGDEEILFQVKAFKNGNLHFRFMPNAIRALNVEAGRLLGWIRHREDVVAELGYSAEDAAQFFGANKLITPSNLKLLTAG